MNSRRRSSSADLLGRGIDFRGGVRGKYAKRYAAGCNIVVLAPDVAAKFQTSASVNAALRKLIRPPVRRGTGR